MSYLEDTYVRGDLLQDLLHVQFGFQCRTCPRCRDYALSPHPLDCEVCEASKPVQKRFEDQLHALQEMLHDEVGQVSAGKGYDGRRHRSITECFVKMAPSLEAWLLKAEGVLPPLRSELRDARAMVGFCHVARQEYTQATAVYEKIAETERVCLFPPPTPTIASTRSCIW